MLTSLDSVKPSKQRQTPTHLEGVQPGKRVFMHLVVLLAHMNVALGELLRRFGRGLRDDLWGQDLFVRRPASRRRSRLCLQSRITCDARSAAGSGIRAVQA